jgi:cytochrome d ubiquinol oxidase subunit I
MNRCLSSRRLYDARSSPAVPAAICLHCYELYERIYKFWSLIFALGFGMGVVSGLVMSFEFGANFSRFAQAVGPVIGPIIGLEVMSAFFLEAGFLGIMLFGWGRVGRKLHFAATCLVSIGTTISASFIMAANSWMQTPAGVTLMDVPSTWWTGAPRF